MSATFELLTNQNLITEYVDARIKKELDHIGVFAQFSQTTILGPQGGSGPADFNYVRSIKSDRGFTITKTSPGAVTRFGKDIYTTDTGQVDIYTGGVELVQELHCVPAAGPDRPIPGAVDHVHPRWRHLPRR